MDLIDVHCHMLPGIDDGSSDAGMSIGMLAASAEAGVTRVCLTPHYYPSEPAGDFISRRAAAYEKLLRAVEKYTAETGKKLPETCLGAEVYYHIGIQHEKLIRELCYEGTHYLLLELPWRDWSVRVFQDIDGLIETRGIRPVIAHLERYDPMTSAANIKMIRRMPVMVQMNAEYVIDKKTRRHALRLIKSGNVALMGSDSHDLRSRAPNLGEAFGILGSSGLEKAAEGLKAGAERIWSEVSHAAGNT